MLDYPVFQVLKNAAKQWPNNPAIHDDFGTMTFAELLNASESLSKTLIADGVGAGMAVGLISRNNRNFIIGIFAVIGTGATVIPMSHQLKGDELKSVLEETHLHVILNDRSNASIRFEHEREIKLDQGSFFIAHTEVKTDQIFAAHVIAPAFMRFTSGTTGKAKGVVISHRSAIERVEAANKILQLGPNDTVIWVLPIAYHFVVSILLYVRFGAAIAIVSDFLPKNIIEMTNRHKGTLIYASPMQIRLLANSSGDELMPSLNRVISTSAGISKDICLDFYKRFQKWVSQAYGIIEIGLPMINYLHSEDEPDAVGTILPDFEVCIFDENNLEVPDGQIGKLGIKGPGMFDAYLNPPVKREAVLVNGFFLTADFATKKDNLVKIEGREKTVINVAGNKVFPEEVEAVIETYPGIKIARISSVPHPLMGQIVQADVVLENDQMIDVEAMLTYCRKRLSTHKIPQRVRIVDALQMTGSGKLVRY